MKNSSVLRTKSMNVLDNELYIGSYSAKELVNKYNSPLYVYDETHIRHKLDLFKKYFVSYFLFMCFKISSLPD